MATNPNQFAQAQAGLAEAYFGDMEEALGLGDSSLQMLLAHSAFLGSEVELSEVVAPVAERLTNIAKASIGMLQTLVDAGAVEVPEGIFGLSAVEALEIEAGDEVVTLNGEASEGVAAASVDDKDAASSDEDDAQEREVSFERGSAENLLVEIFGQDRQAEIESLTDEGMATFGVIVKGMFMQIAIGPRGRANQADRADQLAKFIAGVDHQEIANEYGISVTNLRGALRRLPEASFSKVSQEQKDQVFDGTLNKLRNS